MEYAFHRVKSIGVVDANTLIAQFEDGISKIYDMRQLLGRFPGFKPLLENRQLLEMVHVEGSGYGVVWDDELDLSCNELWDNGTPVPTPFDDLLALSDATELWGLNESTLRKAISYGKLRVGYDVCNFGKQWVVTRSAMIREYGPLKSREWDSNSEPGMLAANTAPAYSETPFGASCPDS